MTDDISLAGGEIRAAPAPSPRRSLLQLAGFLGAGVALGPTTRRARRSPEQQHLLGGCRVEHAQHHLEPGPAPTGQHTFDVDKAKSMLAIEGVNDLELTFIRARRGRARRAPHVGPGEVARLVSDRVHVMRRGALVEEGEVEQVVGHPQHECTQALLAAIPELGPSSLALSADGGPTSTVAGNPDEGDGCCLTNDSRDRLNRELSSPVVHQGPDGSLDVAYTWFRQTIKHVRIPARWRQDA
ncbi:MAG: hypothetical protein ACRYG2_03980 [Janthinobacterium lividum]